jgi:hypothetical protein
LGVFGITTKGQDPADDDPVGGTKYSDKRPTRICKPTEKAKEAHASGGTKTKRAVVVSDNEDNQA